MGFPVERVAGCLLGGAVGDALGAPVEFLTLEQIRRKYGPAGIVGPDLKAGVWEITDDTQMSLFTAEGLLRAIARYDSRGICDPVQVIYHAYLRWLHTQGQTLPSERLDCVLTGWLITCPQLFSQRAPGSTCLSALASGKIGHVAERLNDSKGCGGVMRVAPIGLVPSLVDTFALGADAAAVTHGHPSGYLAAGTFAEIVRSLMEDASLDEAIRGAMKKLRRHEGHQETMAAVSRAVLLAEDGEATPERVEQLGGGWVAEEALAIALHCALVHADDFPRAVCLAANHSGDSDSTAAMTGNLLGAMHGRDGIPSEWLDPLEFRDGIEALAADLSTESCDSEEWRTRYPPN